MKVLAVVGRKGGSGKTSVAVALAGAFAETRETLLIDADPQRSAADWVTGDRVPFAVVHCDTLAALTALLAKAHRDRKAPPPGAPEIIVVDTPPHDAGRAAEAMKRADLILTPCRPSGTDLRAIAPVLTGIRAAGRAGLVVLNAVDPRTKARGFAREALEGQGVPVASIELHNRIAHAEAAVAGLPVTMYEKGGPAAAEARALAAEVLGYLEGQR